MNFWISMQMIAQINLETRVSWSNYLISVFSIFLYYSWARFFHQKKPKFLFFMFLAIFGPKLGNFDSFFRENSLKTRYIREFNQEVLQIHVISNSCNWNCKCACNYVRAKTRHPNQLHFDFYIKAILQV